MQLCCKKFVLRSVIWLLTWPRSIKPDAGSGLHSSEASLSWKQKGRRKARARKNNRKRRTETSGETWKLHRHTALKGESTTETRGETFWQKSIVLLSLLLGMLFLFLLCRQWHAPVFTSGWSLSVFPAPDGVWSAGAPPFLSVALGNALLLFLLSRAPLFF